MNKLYLIVFLVSILPGITGCQTTGGTKQVRYPAEIRGIGESANYPLAVAGFKRGKIMTYSADMTNISTDYDHLSPATQITATIYVYKKKNTNISVNQQFNAEKSVIEKLYPDVTLLKEEKLVFNKNGNKIAALKAGFEVTSIFMNKRQPVYTELMLIKHGDQFIKLRSTAPTSQRKTASRKNVELMNAVNWIN